MFFLNNLFQFILIPFIHGIYDRPKKTLALLNSDIKKLSGIDKKSENLAAFRGESPLQKGVIAIEFWLSIEVTEKSANYSLQSLTVIRCVNKKNEFLLVYEIITRIYLYWNKMK